MKRLWLLISLTALFLTLGIIGHSGEIIALSIPFLVYLGAGLLLRPQSCNLKVLHTLGSDCVRENQPVAVKVSISNHGSNIDEIEFRQSLPPPLEFVEGDLSLLTALPAGSEVHIWFTLKAKRGSYFIPDTQAIIADHFSLFPKTETLPANKQFLSLPNFSKFRHIPIRPEQTRGFPGSIPARRGGSGTDFYGVREYQLGDPLRWVNWKTSARHLQSLYTNEFEREHIGDVGLILDARLQNDILKGKDSLFEHSVQMTASLAAAFLADGNRVSLLIYGFGMERTFPGYGKVQLQRILRALARARPGHNFSLENLNYLPIRLFPPHSQIVVISPLGSTDILPLIRLRSKGYEVLVVSPDPVDFEAEGIKQQPNLKIACRIARIERTVILKRLSRAGITALEWKVNQPITEWLRASTNRRSLRLRHVRLFV